ncbi:hypothetical protein [Dactylosporangium sp. CA-139066]|uniref:hypothetical protein n=1 Tax=Dactylosporangium sp. CA-139066 TaxID=3239930 RepID=UPI003D8F95C3
MTNKSRRQVEPLDPDSPAGRAASRALTAAIDNVRASIAARRASGMDGWANER